jgi:chromosome segregation ATPase
VQDCIARRWGHRPRGSLRAWLEGANAGAEFSCHTLGKQCTFRHEDLQTKIRRLEATLKSSQVGESIIAMKLAHDRLELKRLEASIEKREESLSKDKASLDEEKVILCAERDSLRSQVAEQTESVVNERDSLRSQVAEQAESVVNASNRLAELVARVKELEAESVVNNAERDSLRSQVAEQAESVVNASNRLAESVARVKELEESLSMHQAGLQTGRMDNAISELNNEKGPADFGSVDVENLKYRTCQ